MFLTHTSIRDWSIEMKDIHSELEADSGATQGETENGHESKTEQAVNSKGHPKLSKKSKFWSGIALFILITVLIGLGLSEFFLLENR